MATNLIVALDFHNRADAMELVQRIDPGSCILKVGSEMFTLFGPDFIRELVKAGYKIFLDLKFHDIPNTVAQACLSAAELGVWMINVHASGGLAMMTAAVAALDTCRTHRPLLIAVTILTSMDSIELPAIGIEASVEKQVSRLALLAKQAGVNGVVCSAHEVPMIKAQCGAHFLTVTPGIRLQGDGLDDQSRVMTPENAVKLGSDYLVVGRSITRAPEPEKIINSIRNALF